MFVWQWETRWAGGWWSPGAEAWREKPKHREDEGEGTDAEDGEDEEEGEGIEGKDVSFWCLNHFIKPKKKTAVLSGNYCSIYWTCVFISFYLLPEKNPLYQSTHKDHVGKLTLTLQHMWRRSIKKMDGLLQTPPILPRPPHPPHPHPPPPSHHYCTMFTYGSPYKVAKQQ